MRQGHDDLVALQFFRCIEYREHDVALLEQSPVENALRCDRNGTEESVNSSYLYVPSSSVSTYQDSSIDAVDQYPDDDSASGSDEPVLETAG